MNHYSGMHQPHIRKLLLALAALGLSANLLAANVQIRPLEPEFQWLGYVRIMSVEAPPPPEGLDASAADWAQSLDMVWRYDGLGWRRHGQQTNDPTDIIIDQRSPSYHGESRWTAHFVPDVDVTASQVFASLNALQQLCDVDVSVQILPLQDSIVSAYSTESGGGRRERGPNPCSGTPNLGRWYGEDSSAVDVARPLTAADRSDLRRRIRPAPQ
jgi:hypothetical protein